MISSDFNLFKNITWTNVLSNENANEAYDSFLSKFTDLYNVVFPKNEVKTKTKNLMSPRITKGLVKSSKRKQKLYKVF